MAADPRTAGPAPPQGLRSTAVPNRNAAYLVVAAETICTLNQAVCANSGAGVADSGYAPPDRQNNTAPPVARGVVADHSDRRAPAPPGPCGLLAHWRAPQQTESQ